MDFFQEITRAFPIDLSRSQLLEDKYESFAIEYYISSISVLTIESISGLLSNIPNTDEFTLSLKIGNTLITTQDINQLDKFVQDINYKLQYIEDEEIKTIFTCTKNSVNGTRNIYNFNSFLKYWSNCDSLIILNHLHADLVKDHSIFFRYLQLGLVEFGTKNLFWGYTKPNFIDNYTYNHSKENCHFANFDNYSFNPNCFYVNSNLVENEIITSLKQFQVLFCITGIYDITTFIENKFYSKINGYKSFERIIRINDLSVKSFDVYNKIFNWIYSSEGNVSDKIGLTRNILTIYLENDSIDIPEESFTSLLSSFKTYLKENVSQYIELRHKLIDELSWISQKSSEIIEKYLNNYSKSVFTFLSFFVSVFIVRFLQTGEFTGVFTIELTALSFAFLGVSTLLLIVSNYNLGKEKQRLKRKYKNIKNRFNNLLNPDDINRILSNDEEFNYELEFIKKRQFSYTLLWVLTILLFMFCISFLYYKYLLTDAWTYLL